MSIDVDAIRDPSGKLGSIDIDGLVYTGLPLHPPVREWLVVLRNRTPRYAAQPYRQLAAAAQAAGHDREARQILMAQRQDQLDRASPRWYERAWGALTRVTLGYGYQPWRALIFLAGVITIACVLTVTGVDRGGRAHPATDDHPELACTSLERVAVGLDFSIPILETAADAD